MPYCTQSDLEARGWGREMIQRTDVENTGVVNVTVLATAQALADADINQALRVRGYAADGSLISSDLRMIAEDLTRFYWYDITAPKDVQEAFERASKKLRDFVAGLVAFEFMTTVSLAQSAGDVDYSAPEPLFDLSDY